MISSVSRNIDALRAFAGKLEVSSKNIANMYTDGYRKGSAVITEGSNNNIRLDIRHEDHSVNNIRRSTENPVSQNTPSFVDLSEEIPASMVARRGFEANIRAIQIHEETLGTILDITG